MPLVGGSRITLPLEDVTQVTSTVRADDLGARHAPGSVCMTGDGARDIVKVCGPAATRLELLACLV